MPAKQAAKVNNFFNSKNEGEKL